MDIVLPTAKNASSARAGAAAARQTDIDTNRRAKRCAVTEGKTMLTDVWSRMRPAEDGRYDGRTTDRMRMLRRGDNGGVHHTDAQLARIFRLRRQLFGHERLVDGDLELGVIRASPCSRADRNSPQRRVSRRHRELL